MSPKCVLPVLVMLTLGTADAVSQATRPDALTPSGSSLSGGTSSSGCGVIFSSDRAAFEGQFTDLCNLEDFEEATPAAHIQPLWVGTDDGAISRGDIEGGMKVLASIGVFVRTFDPSIGLGTSISVGADQPRSSTDLVFETEPTTVGFDVYSFGSEPDDVEITVRDCSGSVIGNTQVSAFNTTPTFVGIEVPSGCPGVHTVEIRSTSRSWETADDIVFNGQCDPVMDVDDKRVDDGDRITLAVAELPSSSVGALFVTEIGGSPITPFAITPFSPGPGDVFLLRSDRLSIGFSTMVGLTAFVLDLVAGGVEVTNTKTVFIN